jgi:hypothetical protein
VGALAEEGRVRVEEEAGVAVVEGRHRASRADGVEEVLAGFTSRERLGLPRARPTGLE